MNNLPSLLPTESEWSILKEQATMAVRSGFLPRAVDTAEKAITIALKGRELGIPPMQAFSHIHIIQGKPTISSELMLSLIYKNCPGAVINYLETTNQVCIIEAVRPGHKPTKFKYTIEDAKNAGLLSKDSWKNYPSAMLRARTVSIVARALFPDAIMGCSYIPEEVGAEVGEEGQVIDVSPNRAPSIRPETPVGNGETPDRKDLITFGGYAKRKCSEIDVKKLGDYYWKLDKALAEGKEPAIFKNEDTEHRARETHALIGDYLESLETNTNEPTQDSA